MPPSPRRSSRNSSKLLCHLCSVLIASKLPCHYLAEASVQLAEGGASSVPLFCERSCAASVTCCAHPFLVSALEAAPAHGSGKLHLHFLKKTHACRFLEDSSRSSPAEDNSPLKTTRTDSAVRLKTTLSSGSIQFSPVQESGLVRSGLV